MAAESEIGGANPLIRAQGLSKSYQQRHVFSRQKFTIVALDGIDLTVPAGSTFALVGESGSGKSTLARCLARLETPTAGQVWFKGEDLHAMRGERLFRVRREIQLIFQDTASALDPRFTAEEIIAEPLRVQREGTKFERIQHSMQLMEEVGLRASWLSRRPHEFSGGQRQRLAIARTLALRPRLLILDEALAGLDLSVQAQILNLLGQLQKSHGLTYFYISHDLALVAEIADEVAVIHRGRIVDQAETSQLFKYPQHPQTRALLDAIPGKDLQLQAGPS